jgi:hypothetical protein
MKNYPVKYVTKERLKKVGVSLAQFHNVGPHPNVTGMKEKHWGKDARCLRHGAYVYLVPVHIYDKF